jgi:hypothetical protein
MIYCITTFRVLVTKCTLGESCSLEKKQKTFDKTENGCKQEISIVTYYGSG